ncbi:hypothetical protein C0Q70_20681 [Pomacea canaliculata]|uniref:Uncharacterized protein n=1 Tax=Pomacea canaliculata TaxID=400727 RepID=A0A2T7NGA5_POMCA|nr:hypothetical protein C0Q70_20681 [Pomacea canaliculata]
MNGGEDRGDKRTRQCGSSRKKSDLAGPQLRPPVGLIVVDVVLSRQRWLALLLLGDEVEVGGWFTDSQTTLVHSYRLRCAQVLAVQGEATQVLGQAAR